MPRKPGHGSQSSEAALKVQKRLHHHDSLSAVARLTWCRKRCHVATPLAQALRVFSKFHLEKGAVPCGATYLIARQSRVQGRRL